ncbi:plb1 [Candida metapsilosis]|uniref:Lysophospholipase n=1 Tax=Candida metapsilosis TaxID=273372 RepID=A0A8H7ZAL2_9ASCO|nr:plb1 [Candida metapsilosis]
MHYYQLFFWFVSLISLAQCWSPTNSYAPGKVKCPTSDILRVADTISDQERDWLSGRDKVTSKKLVDFLKYANMSDINPDDYGNLNKSIHIGLAFSGGGYRAMLNGAGQMSALDERTKGPNGEKAKGLNGLLQASTYVAGLSGGAWLVGSIMLNNFTSVQDIVDHKTDIWNLKHSIVNFGGINVVKTYKYYKSISEDQDAKEKAGFELSLTDTWGRALSHQFLSTTDDAGAGMTFSSIQDWDIFKNHEMPFPILVSDARAPHTKIISINSTLVEFNPFEMGSYDASLFQFSNLKYLGTPLQDGKVNGTCYSGFDNAGYVMGTSSSLFNQFILRINTTSLSSAIKSIVTSILKEVDKDEDDVAIYQPNPFYKTDIGKSSNIAGNDTFTLVDGGEDGQNVPLNPLIQPVRDVDVIFAFDNSADTHGWPNGSSLTKTYARQFTDTGNGTIFPHVPDVNTFINLNLTAKPTFFGCDAKNLSSLFQQRNLSFTNDSAPYTVYDSPLIVYTANRPFSYWSNTSTFKLKYKDDERNSIIRNGFEAASRHNLTLDPEWPACVGCAIIRRHQERNGEEQTEQCKKCFERYCWDGTLDSKDAHEKLNFTDQGTTTGNEGTKVGAASMVSFSWTLWLSSLALLSLSVFEQF